MDETDGYVLQCAIDFSCDLCVVIHAVLCCCYAILSVVLFGRSFSPSFFIRVVASGSLLGPVRSVRSAIAR